MISKEPRFWWRVITLVIYLISTYAILVALHLVLYALTALLEYLL